MIYKYFLLFFEAFHLGVWEFGFPTGSRVMLQDHDPELWFFPSLPLCWVEPGACACWASTLPLRANSPHLTSLFLFYQGGNTFSKRWPNLFKVTAFRDKAGFHLKSSDIRQGHSTQSLPNMEQDYIDQSSGQREMVVSSIFASLPSSQN